MWLQACADEKLDENAKSDNPWTVIVFMDPAPEEVNDTRKLVTAVDRMRCGSLADTILMGFELGKGVAKRSNIAGKPIPNMASTLSPEEVRVEIEKSLRAAAAAAGVRSPPTEQRTAALEPIDEAAIVIVREELLTSRAALETKTENC